MPLSVSVSLLSRLALNIALPGDPNMKRKAITTSANVSLVTNVATALVLSQTLMIARLVNRKVQLQTS